MKISPDFNVLDYALGLVRSGILSIDSEGRVWRHKAKTKFGAVPVETHRAENKTQKGYLAVTLGVPGTRSTRAVLAHILVWVHANGPIQVGLQVNHKDLNKANNRLTNLEIVTGAENIQHSYANGRTRPWTNAKEWRPGKERISDDRKNQVISLRRSGLIARRVAELTGISATQVGRILKGGSR